MHQLTNLQFPDEFYRYPSWLPRCQQYLLQAVFQWVYGKSCRYTSWFSVSSKHTQHIPPLQAACWYSRRVFPWLAALKHYCEPVLSPGYYHTFTNKVWIPFFGSIPPFQVCSLLEYSPSALGWDSLELPFIFLS